MFRTYILVCALSGATKVFSTHYNESLHGVLPLQYEEYSQVFATFSSYQSAVQWITRVACQKKVAKIVRNFTQGYETLSLRTLIGKSTYSMRAATVILENY